MEIEMDKIRVAKLLIAKADSTNFPAEAAALREKAAQFTAATSVAVIECDHNYCYDDCCSGECRDCGAWDPDFSSYED